MATSILFVDSRVEDLDLLLSGLDPEVRVVRLDAQRNGVEQIADALAGESGLAAIQFATLTAKPLIDATDFTVI